MINRKSHTGFQMRDRERVFICQKHKIQYCRTILDNVGGLPKKQTLINTDMGVRDFYNFFGKKYSKLVSAASEIA